MSGRNTIVRVAKSDVALLELISQRETIQADYSKPSVQRQQIVSSRRAGPFCLAAHFAVPPRVFMQLSAQKFRRYAKGRAHRRLG